MNKFEKINLKTYLADGGYSEEAYSDIKLPKRATKGSVGYDFYAPAAISIAPGGSIVIPTGIKCQLDEDKGLFIFPRSGLGFKYNMHLANTVGIIDVDYYNNKGNEGHIKIKICNGSDKVIKIAKGEAFAQGVILQFFLADNEENPTEERKGGFGSTTKYNRTVTLGESLDK